MDLATGNPPTTLKRDSLYADAVRHHSAALQRIACGYEADPDKRRDLLQEIHFHLWTSFDAFDQRCSLHTWTFRVAHNTAVSYVRRERRRTGALVSLEDFDVAAPLAAHEPVIDRRRALDLLMACIHRLRPLDRQIMLSWLEGLSAAAIADITGLSPAHVAAKVHRIKTVLARNFSEVQPHA